MSTGTSICLLFLSVHFSARLYSGAVAFWFPYRRLTHLKCGEYGAAGVQ